MAEIDLLNLKPQRISRDLRGKFFLIYGAAKVGKTTLASQVDKVLIASFEPGTNALNNVLVQPIVKWSEWKKVVKQLIRNKEELRDKIDVVTIDTVDEMYKLCEKHICEQNGIQSIKEIPYGGGYKLLDDEFSSTLRELAFAGYGLFFISHSKEKTLKNDNGEEYNQINLALPDRAFQIVNKLVDTIAYLRQVEVEEDGEIKQKRYLFFRGDNRFYAGSRFAYIKPYVELSYQNLVNAICDAVDEEVKHSGGTVSEEENVYNKLDYDNLMEEAKAYWARLIDVDKTDEAAKILEDIFGKPTKFSEIDKSDVELLFKAITEIKELV